MIIAILGRETGRGPQLVASTTSIVLAMRALTLQELQSVASQHGGVCLSDSYTNLSATYRFQCAKGHEFQTRAQGVVQGGTWCPTCAGTAPRTLQDLKDAASLQGGQCLYGLSWCPHCAGNARQSLKGFVDWAKSHGGECLSKRYKNNKTKLRYRCAQGHEFTFAPGEFHQGRGWCQTCRRLDEQRAYHQRLKAHFEHIGYTLVSTDYLGSKVKVLVHCNRGHEWWVRPDNALSQRRCPHCRAKPPSESSIVP